MFVNRYSTPRHLWEYAKFRLRVIHNHAQRVRRQPTDIIFLLCDHFEGAQTLRLTSREIQEWVDRYPRLADRHWDSDGLPPRHTWFVIYADRVDNIALLQSLNPLCQHGYGELELHLHHGRGYFAGKPAENVFESVNTSEQLESLLRTALSDFNHVGALITDSDPPRRCYGVIHGAWALDNSRSMHGYHGWCGVNNELDILKRTGCYADFTFPAWGSMQPAKINSIYYARENPKKPKSYNTGRDLSVNAPPLSDGLVIFEGPALGGCDISPRNPPSLNRIASWIDSCVHVKGRPNWIFVKVHTHGCQDDETMELLLGQALDAFFTELESACRDSEGYRLHYVTAREAYNIARAAEAGMDGNPHDFRDFVITPYLNTKRERATRPLITSR